MRWSWNHHAIADTEFGYTLSDCFQIIEVCINLQIKTKLGNVQRITIPDGILNIDKQWATTWVPLRSNHTTSRGGSKTTDSPIPNPHGRGHHPCEDTNSYGVAEELITDKNTAWLQRKISCISCWFQRYERLQCIFSKRRSKSILWHQDLSMNDH